MNRTPMPVVAALLAAAVTLAITADTSLAQLSGIRYTISPRVDRILFDDQAALSHANGIGARLGFGFGEYLELSAAGRYTPEISTDFSDYGGSDARFGALPARKLSALQVGADLRMNFRSSGLIPFASAGTGVLALDFEDTDAQEAIYLGGGLGLTYRWRDRLTLTLEAQRQQWKIDAGTFTLPEDRVESDLEPGDFGMERTGALSIGLGAAVDLGGRPRGSQSSLDQMIAGQFSGGFKTVRLQAEPAFGAFRFASELGYRDTQYVAGLSSGFDFGPYIGLRAFYLKGFEDIKVATDPFGMYGADLVMRFGSPARTFRPQVSVGGGAIDVKRGYEGNGVTAPKDRPFASAGFATSVQIGRYLGAYVGVKNILVSRQDVGETSAPSSIQSNWGYLGGFTLEVGREGLREREVPSESAIPSSEAELEPKDELQQLRTEVSEQRMLVAQLIAELNAVRGHAPGAFPDSSGAMAPSLDRPADVAAPSLGRPAGVAAPSPRDWISVPVPEEGEIYIRFGPVPAYSAEDLVYYLDEQTGTLTRAGMARPAQGDSVAAATSGADEARRDVVDERRLQAMLADAASDIDRRAAKADSLAAVRMQAQIDARIQELLERLEARDRTIERQLGDVLNPAESPDQPNTMVSTDSTESVRLAAFHALAGYSLTDPAQVLLGGRLEFARPQSMLRLFGDVHVGLGSPRSVLVALTGAVSTPLPGLSDANVYAGAGVGFLSDGDTQLVLNLLSGAGYRLSVGTVFLEFQTQDLLNDSRIVGGLRIEL